MGFVSYIREMHLLLLKAGILRRKQNPVVREETKMFKKSITAAIVVASLTVAMGAFSADANAGKRHWHHGFGWHGHYGGGWHHGGSHRGGWIGPVARHCFWRVSWHRHHYVRVHVCNRAFW